MGGWFPLSQNLMAGFEFFATVRAPEILLCLTGNCYADLSEGDSVSPARFYSSELRRGCFAILFQVIIVYFASVIVLVGGLSRLGLFQPKQRKTRPQETAPLIWGVAAMYSELIARIIFRVCECVSV